MNHRQIAVCSWSLQPKNPIDLATKVQTCGLKNVQLALNPLITNKIWDDVSNILRDFGIDILSGMLEASGEDYTSLETIAQTGGVRQDMTWKDTFHNAQRVAAKAAELEIDLVTFHAGFFPEENYMERQKMIDRVGEILDCFSGYGVNLAFETGQETPINLISILKEINHSTLGVNFDPANMILYGKGNPIEAIQLLSSWIRQVHIKDARHAKVPGTWGEEVPVGDGDFCWKSFLSFIDTSTNLVIEREGGEQRVDDVITAFQLLKGLDAC